VRAQGNTNTMMAASIATFYTHVKVGHVEAGLRTFDKWQPFPEEINRKIADVTADLHLSLPKDPTKTCCERACQMMLSRSPVIP